MAADGQVTLGDTIVKHGAKKLRRLSNQQVLAGFAGTTADAQALFTRFETKLEEYRGNLERAAVELAKDWRTDRMLRRLDALLVVANARHIFLLSGNGDLIRAGRRCHRDRIRRPLCSGRGEGSRGSHVSFGGRDCQGSYAGRRRNMHLH